ncbi:MAG: sigma 54-interacting transcriptional regulator, partial [Gammaproteobacteria bacterium]
MSNGLIARQGASNPDVEAILECLEDPAILLGRDYRILRSNSAYQDLYGDEDDLADRHCYQISHRYEVPCDQAGESCPLKQSLESQENTRVLHIHHTPRGEEYVNVEMWPVKDPATGEVSCFIEILRPSRMASAQARPEGLVGRSVAFQHALALAERVAASEATVMLYGESGTGKELMAEAIHRMSGRSGGPFVPVECAGLPDTLFESELFGYVKGAFTGAAADKPGLVEAATGGTLFLDEVGEIPLSEQVKLLRLMETRRFRRVGDTAWRDTDFRLVCATNKDLAAMVGDGAFREDLYYRLNVFEIELPPLRERAADLAPLCASILERLGRPEVTVSEPAMRLLA